MNYNLPYEVLQKNFTEEIFPVTEYSYDLCGASVNFSNREKHYHYHEKYTYNKNGDDK